MDRRVREILNQADRTKRECTAPAKDVLKRVYAALLAIPEITLPNGIKAKIDPFIPPEIDEDGDARCGFDVLLDNGSHLEAVSKRLMSSVVV